MTQKRKIKWAAGIAILAALTYFILTRYVFADNLGYLTGDVFAHVDRPTHETYINAFADGQINWELAYWSAMIAEYTYAKPSYPAYNLALTTLGFTTARFYSYFTHNGISVDDLMVDVGIKQIGTDGQAGLTLVVFAFRGSVPLVLDSPATRENMRRNMDFFSQPWRDVDATVHRGFYDQYHDFLTYILPTVNERFDLDILHSEGATNTDRMFWITGHSMGGALAEFLTLDLVENGIPPQNILTHGFATPLIASRRLQAHAQSIGASTRIFNIVHTRDMVGRIGYGFIRGRSLAAQENTVRFGNSGIFDRNHHSLPRIYLPFIAAQNNQPLRRQMETSLVVVDI